MYIIEKYRSSSLTLYTQFSLNVLFTGFQTQRVRVEVDSFYFRSDFYIMSYIMYLSSTLNFIVELVTGYKTEFFGSVIWDEILPVFFFNICKYWFNEKKIGIFCCLLNISQKGSMMFGINIPSGKILSSMRHK